MRSVFVQDPAGGSQEGTGRRATVNRLAQAIEAVLDRGRFSGTSPNGQEEARERVLTGWPDIDEELGGGTGDRRAHGLLKGEVHEWFGMSGHRRGDRWVPPLSVLVHLARAAVSQELGVRQAGSAPKVGSGGRQPGLVVWVGEGVWVYPWALGTDAVGRAVLKRSVFVAARSRDERVWAMEVSLRSGAVGVVIADGSGLRMPESRRLQLAAASGKVLGLVARPDWEREELSAARTRWRVQPTAWGRASGVMEIEEPEEEMAWMVDLLRCKGMRPASENARRWIVRRGHGTAGAESDVDLVAGPGGGCIPQERATAARAVERQRA